MKLGQFLVTVVVIVVFSLDQSSAVDKKKPSGLDWYLYPLSFNLGIVNGQETEESEWPFVASIQQAGHQHFCGGSVWNSNFVITAAHCLSYPNGTLRESSEVSVYIGHIDISVVEPASVFKAAELIPHEKFDGITSHGFDIGVIRLEKSINFKGANQNVRCVCNPKPMSTVIPEECWVIGWGAMNQKGYPVTKLREVKIPLRDHTYCEKTFKEIKKDDPIATYDASFLCAGYDEGGKDACQGDSGGPLLCAISTGPLIYALTGLVSFGEGCAEGNHPGYYTKVYHYLEWITEKTGC